jgi:ribosomal protein L40E
MLGRIIKYTLLIVVGGFMIIAGTDGMLRALTNPYFQFRADYIITTIIGHVLVAYVPSSIAAHKGHSAGKWFVYGFFLPPIAFVHSLLTKDYETDYKVCPFCAEKVKKAAKICRYCGSKLPEEFNENEVSPPPPEATYLGDKSEWDGDPNTKWYDRH